MSQVYDGGLNFWKLRQHWVAGTRCPKVLQLCYHSVGGNQENCTPESLHLYWQNPTIAKTNTTHWFYKSNIGWIYLNTTYLIHHCFPLISNLTTSSYKPKTFGAEDDREREAARCRGDRQRFRCPVGKPSPPKIWSDAFSVPDHGAHWTHA